MKLFADSVDPEHTLHSAASDLGLHCLPVNFWGVSRLKWVKVKLQSNLNGSNIFGAMKICSRHG